MHDHLIKIIAVTTTLISIVGGIAFVGSKQQNATPQASSETHQIKVFVNPDNQPLGFVRVELNFDPQQTQLTSEVTSSTLLKNVITKTSMSEANSTGKVVMVLGLAPEDKSQPPLSTFEFASFTATSKDFSLAPSGHQIVDLNLNQLTPPTNYLRLETRP